MAKLVSVFRSHRFVAVLFKENGEQVTIGGSCVEHAGDKIVRITRAKLVPRVDVSDINESIKKWDRLAVCLFAESESAIWINEVTYFRKTPWKTVSVEPSYLPLVKTDATDTAPAMEGWDLKYAGVGDKLVSIPVEHQTGLPESFGSLPVEAQAYALKMAEEVRNKITKNAHFIRMAKKGEENDPAL